MASWNHLPRVPSSSPASQRLSPHQGQASPPAQRQSHSSPLQPDPNNEEVNISPMGRFSGSPRGGNNRGRGRAHQAYQGPPRAIVNTISRPASSSPNSSPGNASRGTRAPMLRHAYGDLQDVKIKVFELPRGCWTYDVYNAFSRFGNIVRVEMDSPISAWVTFHHPPSSILDDLFQSPIRVGNVPVHVDLKFVNDTLHKVKSPVDQTKQYNEFTHLRGNSIDFGVRAADKSMMIMRSIKAETFVTLNLARKEIIVKFPLEVDNDIRWNAFTMPIAQLDKIYKFENSSNGMLELTIPFDSPPRFFQTPKKWDMQKTFKRLDKRWIEWNAWYRQTDIQNNAARARAANEPVRIHNKESLLEIGQWTTYRISMNIATLQSSQWSAFHDALVDHGVTISDGKDFEYLPMSPTQMWGLLSDELSITRFRAGASFSSAFDDLAISHYNLTFEVRYQLEVCLTHGYLKESRITGDFLERLAALDQSEAIRKLEKIADHQMVYFDPMDIFNIKTKGSLKKNIPNYCALSRSVTVTPTTIHVNTPAVETSNRIIRKHMDADRFLRVKFTDERTEGRLFSKTDDTMDAPYDRIKHVMTQGLIVGGRHYEFLAYGNSQFRENGAYFYASTSSVSADNIRSSMGSFDHIRVIAKYGARQGQCFSTTRSISSAVATIRMVEIDDIERNGFTFTDGVGKLSMFLAQMAAKELGIPNAFEDPPSLYQFRLAGCKGVLAVDPEITATTIHIRPSQYKFRAEMKGLEIIRASAFATACLNRQLIIILSYLGVSDDIFLRKQQEMVTDLERAMVHESVAIDKLQRNIDFNQTSLTIAAMILDGFMKAQDPFVMSLLQLWRAYTIKFLKEKARILIEEGAFVLGCVDEKATLHGHFDDEQGPAAERAKKLATLPEIFLRISDPKRKGHYKVVEGVCILARNPSLHPGDIRVVRAVDKPELYHLKNVVVLPQTGDRDIASMCSGGDLDGDDYIVIWDKDLLPQIINEFPMDFTPEKPFEKQDDEPVTVQDIVDFFVQYMKNDSLARIATAHLAQADARGVEDEVCLRLAQLHSQAVDYPKSGMPAKMGHELGPKKKPHFMNNGQRPEHQYYHSKKVLGKLYDQVTLVDFKPQYTKFDDRILQAYPLDEELLHQAKAVKQSYDFDLKRLMGKHALRTEFEAWSVFVLSHNQETRDYTFAEEFGRSIGLLKDQYRGLCKDAAKVKSASAESAKFAPFVTAMYRVTAQEVEEALVQCQEIQVIGGREVPKRTQDPEDMPLISFPWLFHAELGKIATGDYGRSYISVRGMQPKFKARNEAVKPAEKTLVETKEGIVGMDEFLELFQDALE